MPASRSTCALTSARPAWRPSAKPCSNASLCASACRSASPPTVAMRCCAGWPSMSGTVHSATVGPAFAWGSDKLARSLAAETDGALFGHPLCDHDDLFLRRFDIGQFYRAARFHVVLQDFCGALGHVLQHLFLNLGFGPAQRHRQGVGTHFAQQRLNTTVVDVQQ